MFFCFSYLILVVIVDRLTTIFIELNKKRKKKRIERYEFYFMLKSVYQNTQYCICYIYRIYLYTHTEQQQQQLKKKNKKNKKGFVTYIHKQTCIHTDTCINVLL